MDLSIIIVNWKSVEFLGPCLASIEANSTDLNYEVVIVDNASEPSECREVAKSFPRVRVICSEENLGFSRANNLGFDECRGDLVLFLNPDTIVIGDALQRMIKALQSVQTLGAVGCLLLNDDATLQTTCIQPFPTIFNQLFTTDWIIRHAPSLSYLGLKPLFARNGSFAHVDAISGACITAKRNVIEKIGKFSTDYFMYAEDTDLCWKIWNAGWQVGFLDDAQIIHFGGKSSSKRESGFADLAMRESIFTLLRKFRGKTYARAYRFALFLGALARLILVLPFAVVPAKAAWSYAARRTGAKWLNIARWSVGLCRPTRMATQPSSELCAETSGVTR